MCTAQAVLRAQVGMAPACRCGRLLGWLPEVEMGNCSGLPLPGRHQGSLQLPHLSAACLGTHAGRAGRVFTLLRHEDVRHFKVRLPKSLSVPASNN